MRMNYLEKKIFDALYDGVLIADQDTIVRYINPAYTRITKVEVDDIVGKPLLEVRPGAQLPSVIKSGKKLLRIPRKVGEVEYIVNMAPIIEQGEIIGGISILNEINDIYKLTEALNQSNMMIKKLEKYMKTMGKAKYTFENIISIDKNSLETKNLAKRIAKKDSNVLITGESGTGKELYANAIHNASDRQNGPFIAVNCATFDSNLLESELFGYEEGAFTGAKKGGKIGLFEVANGGTLFLDEISEMNYGLQAKLLRTLQENTIRRIGGLKEIPIDIRVIAATNKSLEKMIEENRFRKDLYYRIAVFPINIYPLRDRREDIKYLIENFLDEMGRKINRQVNVCEDVMKLLYSYGWPGNIRELKNTIEFAINMTDEDIIRQEHLPKIIQSEGVKKNLVKLKNLDEIIKETEIAEIKKVILIYGDTVEGKKKAAEALGISLATLYNKLKQ
ncbi:sigma-54 interaction domain-containing protein [Geosporobacter ferrireducens]|uniref:Fis family transcriptional regulator n=1 Tax=Geosporobacter ferrireducens TaxID=1424294 RepID=A0A1D8GEP7_9FIRM|nr:sigma 54-interacting transcriptional regulator [Geosporobacter ferrireducens]AOT69377.1 Fis family transcriptional regulator [Geosporobacter ferrireducens]MTI57068.1 PAS domain-containing protein [Geosporobacter ferrireducens]